MFVQPPEGKDIGTTIAELGEESGDVLRSVVSAHNNPSVCTGDSVLGDHSGTGFDVALVEVANRIGGTAVGVESSLNGVLHRIYGVLDVNGEGVIGLDEVKGDLGIGLVSLDAVGEANA